MLGFHILENMTTMIERGWALQSLQILGIDNIELFLGTIAHFLGINCSRKLLDYVHWIMFPAKAYYYTHVANITDGSKVPKCSTNLLLPSMAVESVVEAF